MTLLAPAFLVGLLAIGLPIWLHRLSSENPNRKPFSSLMFLEAGEPRRVLAKNLQYLLLLALRIGVLALLALAFSQPALWLRPDDVQSAVARSCTSSFSIRPRRCRTVTVGRVRARQRSIS